MIICAERRQPFGTAHSNTSNHSASSFDDENNRVNLVEENNSKEINVPRTLSSIPDSLLSENIRLITEKVIVRIAISAFVIHLFLIFLVDSKLLTVEDPSGLLKSPIVAIYTPFSFILVYEVYLLIYYLPKSISKYVGKQYEIITLIIIRRIFKDIAKIDLESDWFSVQGNLWFTYDIAAAMILFFLILIFYRLNDAKESLAKLQNRSISPSITRFVQTKRLIAACLVPLFLILAIFNLSRWLIEINYTNSPAQNANQDINSIFFDDFFTILILVDVLLLLISLPHTHEFNKVIRNSGFIISTILIKLTFGVVGLLDVLLTIGAVLIGVVILAIHNEYEKLYQKVEEGISSSK